MLKKVEHIGIAVKSLKKADTLFTSLLGQKRYKSEDVYSESVSVSFFTIGETKIELLEATSPESTIAKFITKKGEGIHHIAFEVDDIHAEVKRLEEEGFVLISKEPKKGADNKLVCFLHPSDTHGVLIELCQEIKSKV